MSKGEKFEVSLRRRVASMALPARDSPTGEAEGRTCGREAVERRGEFIHLVMLFILGCWTEAGLADPSTSSRHGSRRK